MKIIYNKSLYYLLLATTIVSCIGGGVGDTTEKLSGNYYYRTDGSMRYIVPDNIFKVGVYPTVKEFAFNDEYILVYQVPSEKLIKHFLAEDILSRYGSIAYFMENSATFNKQELAIFSQAYKGDSSFYKMLSKELSPNNTEKDRIRSQLIAQQIIDTSFYYQKMIKSASNYWIISHCDCKEFGPYSKIEFIEKAKKLTIPYDLLSNFESKIRE